MWVSDGRPKIESVRRSTAGRRGDSLTLRLDRGATGCRDGDEIPVDGEEVDERVQWCTERSEARWNRRLRFILIELALLRTPEPDQIEALRGNEWVSASQ